MDWEGGGEGVGSMSDKDEPQASLALHGPLWPPFLLSLPSIITIFLKLSSDHVSLGH